MVLRLIESKVVAIRLNGPYLAPALSVKLMLLMRWSSSSSTKMPNWVSRPRAESTRKEPRMRELARLISENWVCTVTRSRALPSTSPSARVTAR